MQLTDEQTRWFSTTFDQMVAAVDQAVRGKERVVRLALTCLLAQGHLLLEDNPGTGKTQLAKAIAATVHSTHSRIQFTPDLLPSDVTGVTVFDQKTQQFDFRPGPIFASIVLADEINRASPKTQSALLEVMEEGKVTVDGVSHSVGSPFMVIATQNPIEQAGTYRLPEAQLDRFLMKTSLGYPDHEVMVQLLGESGTRDRSSTVSAMITAQAVSQMSELAGQVYVDPSVLTYLSRIVEQSRRHAHVALGVSVRGALAFVRCVQVWAVAHGRDHVLPDDIKDLAEPVFAHRLILNDEAQFAGIQVGQVIEDLLEEVATPAYRVG